jgi:hypothetical protein
VIKIIAVTNMVRKSIAAHLFVALYVRYGANSKSPAHPRRAARRGIAGRIKNAVPSRSDLTTHFCPLRIRHSHVSHKCGNSKSPAHNSNQRNASCAGRENPVNATRCDADEHVAELELQSRLRFVGTLPKSRSRSKIPRPAPG